MSGPRSSRIEKCRLSLACPGVRSKAIGRPPKSVLRWILVEKPPRERPRAWPFWRRPSSGCIDHLHGNMPFSISPGTRYPNSEHPLVQESGMRLVRFGPEGSERPGILDANGDLRSLGPLIRDIDQTA